MRWLKSDKRARVCSGFLLLPKLVGREWRWLEFARWKVRYVIGTRTCAWVATEWLN